MDISDEEAINLVRESARKFALADISWAKARMGIMGFWVGGQVECLESDPLLRAKQSCALWTRNFLDYENPYHLTVRFLESGGCFIRWEHHVLDVICPSSNKYGLPEQSFIKALNVSKY
jgi:hypothetical protein